jgi:hypothetical protein
VALSPAQRALATLLADRAPLPVHHLAMPLDGWNRRRWLGLEPPGPLEELEGGVPRWRLLAQNEDDEVRTALLCRLPLPARIRAMVELDLGAYRLTSGLGDGELWVTAACAVDEIDGSGATWAPPLADWLAGVASGPDWHKNRGALPMSSRWRVFTALVRAGVPIEPRWDGLLPIGGGTLLTASVTCIRALPAERQVPAIRGALGGLFPGEGVEVVLQLLQVMPSPALMDLFDALVTEDRGRPGAALRADLAAAAKNVPALAALLAGRAPAVEAPRLHLRRLRKPAPGKLTPLQKKQLGRYAKPGEEGYQFVELYAVDDDDGEHVYDMFLYCGDDGSVYVAGKTKEVARFSQGGPDVADKALAESLGLALYELDKQPAKKKPKAKAKQKPKAKAKQKPRKRS